MSAIATQTTIGPVAAARPETLASRAKANDERPSSETMARTGREVLVFVLAATLLALLVAVAAQMMPGSRAEAVAVTPEEVFIVDPDGQEPVVVCTERAGVRRCGYLDVIPVEP